ncbi:hypothetical protein [Streptomyces showdoensis]|uniref:BON domain-containing protein n=1 Tax=Streptomyces showdoensis TaxID=68268 RepID=A0A2P2GHN3_STREW|nr:hypothetical protein [Streptomyces showdoensis]KKZ71033.1 hypothetical protein VO63_25920 [Streptomyces showdoensis]
MTGHERRITKLRERLAGDRLAELGVSVEQRGAVVVITGTVSTPQRRDEVLRTARRELADLTLVEDLVVACADVPDRWEELP